MLVSQCHIIEGVCNFENIKNCASIFLSIVTGVSIIKGLNYLKGLREKTNAATFTFWSQFRIRIYELMSWLKEDDTLINNLYELKGSSWESELSQDDIRIKEYKDMVKKTIDYIEKTQDQMPAYVGWTSDFNKIVGFLNDLIQYDMCDSKRYFKFVSGETLQDKKEYCRKICETMERLCKGIEEKQKKVECDIFESWKDIFPEE